MAQPVDGYDETELNELLDTAMDGIVAKLQDRFGGRATLAWILSGGRQSDFPRGQELPGQEAP